MLKEQFIDGMNTETIKAGIIKELTILKDAIEMSSEEVLMWVQRVEAQECRRQY